MNVKVGLISFICFIITCSKRDFDEKKYLYAMKLFQTVLKNASVVGVNRNSTNKNKFNRRNLTLVLMFGILIVSTIAYIYFDANTIKDYEQSFFALFSALTVFPGFLILIEKSRKIDQFVRAMENTIDARKLNEHLKF